MDFLGYLILRKTLKMNNNEISNQIKILLNQFSAQNFELVLSKAKTLIKKNPEYAILYNLIGSAHQNLGNYNDAEKYFKDGLKLDPKNIALMNNLAMSYKNLLKYKKSEDLYLNIIDINNKYVNAYVNLGNLKRDLNQFQKAIKLYETALSIDNKNPIIHYSLALAHQGIGNFERSIYYSENALRLNPKFTRADHIISQSNKYKKDDKHFQKLKKKINNNDFNKIEKIDLYFALAKAEEDLGNIEDASKYLLKGNKLKKEIINYNVHKEIKFIEDIKDGFEKNEINNSETASEKNMIFILGMPRSGTSLIEQIITSHSDVFGGGELPILSNIVKKHFIKDGEFVQDELTEIISDTHKREIIRNEYFDFIRSFQFSEKFITDKAPLNFRWIGFIKLLFPEAKIIHCSRDPKNNCLSMFKNLFEGGLNFTYDQKDLVEYYKNYLGLMFFWKDKYGNFILDIKYENLIKNNVEEIKKIVKFVGLSWEEQCLAFHKNKTPIKTMSTAQARQPIYKSSLNLFEKFGKYLTILDKGL